MRVFFTVHLIFFWEQDRSSLFHQFFTIEDYLKCIKCIIFSAHMLEHQKTHLKSWNKKYAFRDKNVIYGSLNHSHLCHSTFQFINKSTIQRTLILLSEKKNEANSQKEIHFRPLLLEQSCLSWEGVKASGYIFFVCLVIHREFVVFDEVLSQQQISKMA